MPSFTPDEREQLRAALVSAARSDDRIEAAAHTGSASVGRQDRWSDIDLALRVADGVDIGEHEPRGPGADDQIEVAPQRATACRGRVTSTRTRTLRSPRALH